MAAIVVFALGALTMGLAMFVGIVMEDLMITMAVVVVFTSTTIWFSLMSDAGAQPSRSDAEVQCSMGHESMQNCEPFADQAIYLAPNSVRWHRVKMCRHLKAAGKINTLTPCKTCCGTEPVTG